MSDLYGKLILAMAILLCSAVVVPLIAEKRRLAGWLNFVFVAVAGAILLSISYSVIFVNSLQAQLVSVGPLDMYFLLDSFSGFFLGIIALMAIVSAFYSIEYMEHYDDYGLRSYYANYPIFVLGMAGIVTVDDLTTGFTIAWQAMTITSYFLVRFEHRKPEIVRAANKYLILMQLAWVFIVVAAFIAGTSMGDSIHAVTRSLGNTHGAVPYIVYGLLFLGFGFKAAVFPFGQMWLPDAHSIAPSPISALLSGVMIKTGVYGIIRTFFWMVPHAETFHFSGAFWGVLIASFGVVTLFIGTVQSMKQSHSKRLLAYSSIGQVGYIILGIGAALFMVSAESASLKMLGLIALVGVVYHILNHAVFKGLLFLTSGSVLYSTGTKDLNKLGGLINLMPVTALVAGISSLSISGVPPFSGFASKWTLVSTSLLAGSEVLFLVIFGIIALFTSAVTLSCYVKFFGMTFTSAGAEWGVGKKVKEVPAGMLIPKLFLAALCLLQGLIPFFYFQTIIGIFANSGGSMVSAVFRNLNVQDHVFNSAMGVSVGIPGLSSVSSIAVPAVLLIIFAAAFGFAAVLKRAGGSKEREVPTWLCGYQDLHDKTRYRDKSMFSALKNLLHWTGGNVK
ncbi:MAG TPA: proton-conducting transporter membrane subunit [Spirochaetota bacterium]|nr:proton-conducting transporter membrane subunit [Spirochaetota bacterium]